MSVLNNHGVSRRGMMAGLGLGAGAVTVAGLMPADAALLPEPETVREFDVVVVGSGLSGCAVALQAAQSGAKVAVLEKASESRMGGNSLLAGGTFAVPLGTSASDRQGYVEDFEAYCLGRGNRAIFQLMADHILDDIEWLKSNGVEILEPTRRPLVRTANATVAPGSFAGLGK